MIFFNQECMLHSSMSLYVTFRTNVRILTKLTPTITLFKCKCQAFTSATPVSEQDLDDPGRITVVQARRLVQIMYCT